MRQASSITMPPRSPTARPAARASSSRGRMPAENTIRSVSSSLPSAKRMRCACARAVDDLDACSCRCGYPRPARAMRARSTRPPTSSICTAISRGANSTTWVSSPRSLSALAASSPSRPPPMTTPRLGLRTGRRGWPPDPRWCDRRSNPADRARGSAARRDTSRSPAPDGRSRTRGRWRVHLAALAIDAHRPLGQGAARSPLRSKKPGSTSDRSSALLPEKIGRQMHAVVGRARLLAQHRDLAADGRSASSAARAAAARPCHCR